jgi:hypothetical protein
MDNVQPRSYQLEMFDLSMKENIIAVVRSMPDYVYPVPEFKAEMIRCPREAEKLTCMPYIIICPMALEMTLQLELVCESWRNWNAVRNIR